MSFLLGLTGSIGMGKSTAAAMFADEGVPVWDADAAVHRLYATGGPAVAPITARFPAANRDGAISRDALKAELAKDPAALVELEKIVHPLIAQDRQDFIDNTDAPILLFDIPLLFETGADAWLDAVVVVSAPSDVQRARVLSRPGMTEEQFDLILSRQLPDPEKRARADHVLPSLTLEETRAAVQTLLAKLHEAGHA